MKYTHILSLLAAVVTLASCENLFWGGQVGQAVSFSAMAAGDPQTRASYAEQFAGNRQLIEWDKGDSVTIFMLYREKEQTGQYEYAEAQYTITPTGNSEAISRGTLTPADLTNILQWKGETETNTEYFHRFYSVYPAGCAQPVGDENDRFEFYLPDKQDGQTEQMRYAYMAAANTTKQKSNIGSDFVALHYYPMVTTIQVTLKNASETETISFNRLSIVSANKQLAGNYQAVLGSRGEGETGFVVDPSVAGSLELNKNEVYVSGLQAVLEPEATDTWALFLCPQTYETGDLQLWIDDTKVVESLANNADNENKGTVTELKPYGKYNITVTLSKQGNTVTIEDLSVGGVQMLVEYLNYLKEKSNKLESFLSAVGINNDENKWYNNVFDKVIKNNHSGNLSAEDWLAQIEQLDEELKRHNDPIHWPEESKLLELFQYLFDNVTDLTITGNHSITANLQPQDFQIYKNLQTINIHLENGTNSIEFEEMPNLTSITITGNVGKLDIKVKKCKKLNTIDVTALDKNSDRTITIDECSSVDIKKGDNNRWTITIDGVKQ